MVSAFLIVNDAAVCFEFDSPAAWMSFARLNGLIDLDNEYVASVMQVVYR